MNDKPKPVNTRVITIVLVFLGYALTGVWWGATVAAEQNALKEKHDSDMSVVKEHIKEIKVRQRTFDTRQIKQGQLLVEIKTLIKRRGV